MKKTKWTFFKIVSVITAVIFAYLFLTLLLNSETFINDLGLPSSEPASILARRTSIFMLGISILMIGSINLPNSKARQIICLATGITMFGLSCMGTYELIKGTVNTSMLTAIIIETTLWVSFGIIFFTNRRKTIEPNEE
jgi:uncharacterized membrane protein YiaA